MAGRQPVTLGQLCIAGLAAIEHATFEFELRPGGAVNGSVDPAATEQRGVGCVDDGIDSQLGDVAGVNADPVARGAHHHILNTPKRVPSISALSAADRLSASTSRVLAGSMMPSSQSLAEE